MTHNFISQFRAGKVDSISSIISDVSVCTIGEAKGHGVFCDMTMLQQVKSAMENKRSGTKVQLDHGSSAKDVIGKLVNPRIKGDQLFADFHLFSNSPHRSYILEVANEIPEEVGMSISFSGKDVQIGGKVFARCEKLHSCDLVNRPAANPSGLFSVGEGNENFGASEISEAQFYKMLGNEQSPVRLESLGSGAQTCRMPRSSFRDCLIRGVVKPVGFIRRGGQKFFLFGKNDLSRLAEAHTRAMAQVIEATYKKLDSNNPQAAIATLQNLQSFTKK
ncbi:MAG: hypothetical protein PHV34_01815 [Verrucomicrobiae bacterium]|nr:hypothetical protein [Verrucomicrobiae bacterium]